MLTVGSDAETIAAHACGVSREALRQLQSLVAERQANSWRVGDTLVAIYGAPPHAAHHDGTYEHLSALADNLGCSLAWLSATRITAAAWPPRERRPTVSWSVHRELAGRPGRIELLAAFIEHCHHDRVTPSTVRLRSFLARTSPTTTRRGFVDPLVRLERAALRLDRCDLLALIERLQAALQAPVAA